MADSFDRDSPDPSWDATRPMEAPLGARQAPATIDRYVLLRRLGAGSMGEVFAAFDPELDRKIAIKLLHPRLSDDAAQRRLQREAQAMAKLSHPNVVAVHDVGAAGRDVFVAMEWVRGSDLGAWLDAEKRSWPEILGVFEQAGRGLEAAHGAGLVHRDFKPENVLLSPEGGAKVTDFGLARSALDPEQSAVLMMHHDALAGATDSAPTQDLTATGALVGTPAYMAPELYHGETADALSDQFAYCVAFWQALYGERPFTGKSLTALMKNILDGTINEPPADADVPSWLHDTLRRGLSTDAKDRWPSMAELLAALHRNPERLQQRNWMLGAGLAAVLVIGASTAHYISATRSSCSSAAQLTGVWDAEQRSRLQVAFERPATTFAEATWMRTAQALDDFAATWSEKRETACRAHKRAESSGLLYDRKVACLEHSKNALEALVGVLAQVDEHMLPNTMAAVGDLPRPEHCLDREALLANVPPPKDPEVADTVENWREQLLQVRSLYRTGMARSALALVKRILPEIREVPYPPLQAEALYLSGRIRSRASELEQAEANLTAAWEIALEHDDLDVAHLAAIYLVRLNGYEQSNFEKAEIWASSARALSKRMGHKPEGMASYYRTAALVAERRGDQSLALDYIQKALEETRKHYAEGAFEVERNYNLLGRIFAKLGQWQNASEAFEISYRAHSRKLGENHPWTSGQLMNLGNVYGALGEPLKEREVLYKAYQSFLASHGEGHVLVAQALTNLGLSYSEPPEADFEKARGYLAEALRLMRRRLGEDHIDVARAQANLGRVLITAGELGEAERALRGSLAILERLALRSHPTYASALYSLGHAQLEAGQLTQAKQSIERSIEMSSPGSTSPSSLGERNFDLARALWQLGERRSAIEQMGKAWRLLGEAENDKAGMMSDIDTWFRQRGLEVPERQPTSLDSQDVVSESPSLPTASQ